MTYNLHIMMRFELEQALLAGRAPRGRPAGGVEREVPQYLGIQSPTDADGVLQDVHWSAGLIGYFPTYSLGNLYAAQLFEQAERDLGDLASDVPPRRVPAAPRLAADARPRAGPPLCPSRNWSAA